MKDMTPPEFVNYVRDLEKALAPSVFFREVAIIAQEIAAAKA